MLSVSAASYGLLAQLSSIWGYVTLGVSSIIAEEAAPVLAGFAAHQGHLHAARAAIACAVGSWIADVALYALGRSRVANISRHWPRMAAPIERLLDVVRRHPWRAALSTRFAYGARLILPITCGAARIRRGQFLAGSAASALLWGGLFTVVGWAFGQTAVELIAHLRRYEDVIALALVAIVTLAVVIVTARNRKRVPGEIGGQRETARLKR